MVQVTVGDNTGQHRYPSHQAQISSTVALCMRTGFVIAMLPSDEVADGGDTNADSG